MISLEQEIIEKLSVYFQNPAIVMKKPYMVKVQGIRIRLEPCLRDDRLQQAL
jgi:hypothetical protein